MRDQESQFILVSGVVAGGQVPLARVLGGTKMLEKCTIAFQQTIFVALQERMQGYWQAQNQGRRKDSRARGADRSKRAPTTLGQ